MIVDSKIVQTKIIQVENKINQITYFGTKYNTNKKEPGFDDDLEHFRSQFVNLQKKFSAAIENMRYLEFNDLDNEISMQFSLLKRSNMYFSFLLHRDGMLDTFSPNFKVDEYEELKLRFSQAVKEQTDKYKDDFENRISIKASQLEQEYEEKLRKRTEEITNEQKEIFEKEYSERINKLQSQVSDFRMKSNLAQNTIVRKDNQIKNLEESAKKFKSQNDKIDKSNNKKMKKEYEQKISSLEHNALKLNDQIKEYKGMVQELTEKLQSESEAIQKEYEEKLQVICF